MLTPTAINILQISTNSSAVTQEVNYQSISDLLKDEQMFRIDQDPTTVFDISSEDFNNNSYIPDMDLQNILSDDYISRPEDIEMFSCLELLNENFDLEKSKEEKEEENHTLSPIPAIAIPSSPVKSQKLFIPSQTIAVKMMKNEETVKIEEQDEFDLIKYINSQDVSEIENFLYNNDYLRFLSSQTDDVVGLTPVEEKSCPTFTGFEIDPQSICVNIKPEPLDQQPSTSTSIAPSRRNSDSDSSGDDQNSNKNYRPRRQIKKRRYSSDSEFSIGTSASSYNSTRQKSIRKKRGRPAKELITKLPTIDDFAGLPKDKAEHLVLRIKNNEASRKSRMKSKNQQDRLEEECNRLEWRKKLLKNKKRKLNDDIEKLRTWLLARG